MTLNEAAAWREVARRCAESEHLYLAPLGEAYALVRDQPILRATMDARYKEHRCTYWTVGEIPVAASLFALWLAHEAEEDGA